MRTIRFLALLASILWTGLLSQPASLACLNDRDSDTLANQAQGLPDVVRIITGRFERNPSLFYEMRITRVKKELQKDPSQLLLYDDIAVAQDRVGRDDEAIAWLRQKKTWIDKFIGASPHGPARDKAGQEHLYRYCANLGTCMVHRWLRSGANRNHLADLKAARDLIARAIQIKPNAHFGREKYQLMAMDWMLEKHGTQSETSGYHYYHAFSSYMWGGFVRNGGVSPVGADTTNYSGNDKRKVEGLSGLIALGNAWESVDIFDALSQALQTYTPPTVDGKKFAEMNAFNLACLARLRSRELIEKGHHPLFATTATKAELLEQWGTCYGLYPKNIQILETNFHRLRQEADQWQSQRTTYMTALLKAGRHPDIDPTFWRGWRNSPPPSLEIKEHWQTYADERREQDEARALRRQGVIKFWVITLGVLTLLGLGLAWRARQH